jgi:hypothetical protein
VEMVGGLAQAGQAASVVHVWHTPGGVTLTEAIAPVPGWSGEVPHIMLPADFGGQAVAGAAMLGMSPRLVALLSKNYRVTAAGWGQVAGRPAQVVTALRPGGWPHGSGWTGPPRCRCGARRSTRLDIW